MSRLRYSGGVKRAFLFVLGALISCSPPPPPAPVGAEPVPSVTILPRPVTPPPPGPSAPRFDESLLHGHEFLLELSPSAAVVQDPVAGPLTRNPELVQAVEDLVAGAGRGELDGGRLVPRWTEYLQAWARKMKAAGFVAGPVRVSTPLQEGPEGTVVAVRILGKKRDYTGWVVLVPEDHRFLVTDVQLVPQPALVPPVDPEAGSQPISRPNRL